MKTLVLRLLALIILPSLAVSAYFFFNENFGIPQVKGELQVSGIQENISIERDDNGTVYIKAPKDDLVFFGMGLAHAQDRLWQLELQRRIAQGRLSELFGASSVSVDAQMRTLGLYDAAKSAWASLSPQAKSSLIAYSAGINSWLEKTDGLPPEFYIFDITPEPWTPIDSLAWSKVFALHLSDSMWSELSRFMAKSYLNDDQLSEFFANYSQDSTLNVAQSGNSTVKNFAAISQLHDVLKQHFIVGSPYVGSNAWVVSGKLTDNGQALLGNDPHLGLQIPSLWYMASLTGERINAVGMTLVGLPVIIFGRNQKVAWGGTNLMADVQDLYFEQVKLNNPKQYLNNGQWLEFKTRKEYIKVRPEFPVVLREAVKPVEIRIRETVRGPVISDAFGLSDQPISLRWTALDDKDTSYEAFLKLNYVSDWGSFKSALSHYVAPNLNFLYIDVRGNIGYLGAGKIPIREKGRGNMPVHGGSSDYFWRGYVPFEQWPQSYNPPEGFIVSANNKLVGDDYPFHISDDWAPPARANRIEQMLSKEIAAGRKISLDYVKTMQTDTLSLGAKRLLDLLKTMPMETEQQHEALQFIKNWDGDMAADSIAASIFYSWTRHLRIAIYKDAFKADYGRVADSGLLRRIYLNTTYDQILAALTPGSAFWCENNNSILVEDCSMVVRQALNDAIKELSKLAGADMNDWAWGEINTGVYAHNPFSRINLFKKIFERRVAAAGGPNTVNVSSSVFRDAEGYEQTFGAGFRQIMRIGDQGVEHFYMNSTGQSGNVFSQHYDDMVELFSQGRYHNVNEARINNKLLLISQDNKSTTNK
ncbi:MAG: penicillin amidase [Rheinheimera sp.]|mgnify:CR=1 FL=1|nr:penicillin amidase [Rheinheimera sp.]MBM35417.1 penicillin amidase [Rheinheimera sp.]|tara:strand:+ start:27448 stop:29895 length:2448 start_codon:yes stop_codon:yes gene_type:complete